MSRTTEVDNGVSGYMNDSIADILKDFKENETGDIESEERKLRSMEINEIIKYISDFSYTVSEDYIIRRYIVENKELSQKILPDNYKIKNDTGEIWDKNIIKEAAKNLKELQSKNGIKENISWDSFLENKSHNFKYMSAFRIAFTLGMNVKETEKLLCAWDCNSFDVHNPQCLAALFCMSNESLNNYTVYKEMCERINDELNSANYLRKVDNKRHFFDNIPSNNKATRCMYTHINPQNIFSKNDDEKKEDFMEYVRKNARELKQYSTSNTNRRIIKTLLDDLKKVYKPYEYTDKNRTGWYKDVIKKGEENIEFKDLMSVIKSDNVVYESEEENMKDTKENRANLPQSVIDALNMLQKDITDISHSAVKVSDKAYRVKRRTVIMLVYLLLNKYLLELIAIYRENDVTNINEVDTSFLDPVTLRQNCIKTGNKKMINEVKKAAIYICRYEGNDNKIIDKKIKIFRQVVNHYMSTMHMYELYLPNPIDRFFTLIFMTNDPDSILKQIINTHSEIKKEVKHD